MAGLGQLTQLPELVRDSRLDATFQLRGTQHLTIHIQGASRRAKQTKEVWEHKKTLGRGGFGSVELQAKESKRAGPTEFRAVKSIRVPEDEVEKNHDFYVRELEAIVKFSQARYGDLFVKSYGWFTSDSTLYIAMEYCELGDLQHYIDGKCKSKGIPEAEAHEIASQVLDALDRTHQENFTHRDLKPANLLIKGHPPDNPWIVKVADFGISKRDAAQTTNMTTTVKGTRPFMPPELLGFSNDDSRSADLYAADMWCYGQTIYTVLAGKGAFASPAELYGYFFGRFQFPASVLESMGVSKECVNFLQSLIICNPTERLTSTVALEHPWIETEMHRSGRTTRPTSFSSGTKDMPQSAQDAVIEPSSALTSNTEASASWTNNFSELQIEDKDFAISQNRQPTQPIVRLSDQGSQSDSNRDIESAEKTPGWVSQIEVTGASASWTAAIGHGRGEDSAWNQGVQNLEKASSDQNNGSFSIPKDQISTTGEESSSVPNDQTTIPTNKDLITSGSESLKQISGPSTQIFDRKSSPADGIAASTIKTFQSDASPAASSPLSPNDQSLDSSERGIVPQPWVNNISEYGVGFLSSESRDLEPCPEGSTWEAEVQKAQEYQDFGDVQRQSGNLKEAENYFRKILRCRTMEDRFDSEVVAGVQRLAEVLEEQKLLREARDLYHVVYMSTSHIFGADDQITGSAMSSLAFAELQVRGAKDSEVLALYKDLVKQQLKSFGPDHPFTLDNMQCLATIHSNRGEYDSAIDLMIRVEETAKRIGDIKIQCQSLSDLTFFRWRQHKFAEAYESFQHYSELRKNVVGPVDKERMDLAYHFAHALATQYGQTELAAKVADDFFELCLNAMGSGEPLTTEMQAQWGEMRKLVGGTTSERKSQSWISKNVLRRNAMEKPYRQGVRDKLRGFRDKLSPETYLFGDDD